MFNKSGLYSSGNGRGKLGFDSVGMIFRLFFFLLQRFKKENIHVSCHVMLWGWGGVGDDS